MTCNLYDHDSKYYAQDLIVNEEKGRLEWDSANGQSVLIVQTPFGVDATARLEEFCRRLSEIAQWDAKFQEVGDGAMARVVEAGEKARNGGCQLNGKASRYSVYPCVQEGDELKVFRPQQNAFLPFETDVPLQIRVEISRDEPVQKKGLFKKKNTGPQFFVLRFPPHLDTGYRDGSLMFKVGALEIPVTKEVLQQGTVYIEAPDKAQWVPELKAVSGGYEIVN